MAKITVTFSLDSERDKRILRWLEGLPKRKKSEAIREALTAHLGQNGITLRDIYEAVMDLRRSGLVVVSQDDSGPQPNIPPDVLDNLGKLGL